MAEFRTRHLENKAELWATWGRGWLRRCRKDPRHPGCAIVRPQKIFFGSRKNIFDPAQIRFLLWCSRMEPESSERGLGLIRDRTSVVLCCLLDFFSSSLKKNVSSPSLVHVAVALRCSRGAKQPGDEGNVGLLGLRRSRACASRRAQRVVFMEISQGIALPPF